MRRVSRCLFLRIENEVDVRWLVIFDFYIFLPRKQEKHEKPLIIIRTVRASPTKLL